MDAFLTGGSGFVGSHVARLLVERGARVRCLVRPTSRTGALRALGVELVVGDVRDGPSVRRAMRGATVAYHCAADYRLHARATLDEQARDVRADEPGAAGEEGVQTRPPQPRKFQAAMRARSRGLLRRPRTADASNPECIAQFWQRSSFRDSQ